MEVLLDSNEKLDRFLKRSVKISKTLTDAIQEFNEEITLILKNCDKIEKKNRLISFLEDYCQATLDFECKIKKEFLIPIYSFNQINDINEMCYNNNDKTIRNNNHFTSTPLKQETTILNKLMNGKSEESVLKSVISENINNNNNNIDDAFSVTSLSKLKNNKTEESSISQPNQTFHTTNTEETIDFKFMTLDCFEYKMRATYIKSPILFYMQLDSSINIINNIGNMLNEKYMNNDDDDLIISNPKLNSIVAAQYSKDLCWYRAKVISVNDKTKTVEVYYVDYGNTESLEINKIKKLDPQFLQDAGQAIPCSLAHAFPANSDHWSYAANKRFQDLVVNTKLIVKIFLDRDWPINFCTIRKNDKDILDILVNEKHAKYVTDTLKLISTFLPILEAEKFLLKIVNSRVEIMDKTLTDENNNILNDNNNNSVVNSIIFNKNSVIDHKEIKDNKSTRNESVLNGKLSSTKSEKMNSTRNLAINIIESKNTKISKTIPPRLIELDDEYSFACEILSIKNPNEFFIRPLNKNNNDDNYQLLNMEIQNFYEQKGALFKINDEIFKDKNNKFFVAKYKSKYHRAVRIQNHNLMFFIDHGHYYKIPINDLYQLHDEFFKLPPRIVQCSLAGVMKDYSDDYWPEKTIEWFRREIKKYDNFNACIVSKFQKKIYEYNYDKPIDIILVINRINDKRYVLNDDMIRAGLAKLKCTVTGDTDTEVEDTKKKRIEEYVESCNSIKFDQLQPPDEMIDMGMNDIYLSNNDINNNNNFYCNYDIDAADDISSQEKTNSVPEKSSLKIEKNILEKKINLQNLQTSIIKNEEFLDWNPMKDDYESARNNYNYNDEDVDHVMYGYTKNTPYVCRNYLKGNCYRKNCPYIHTKNTTVREFSYTSVQVERPDYLCYGSTIFIQITNFIGFDSYNAQVFAYWNRDLNNIVDVNYLIELTNRMKNFYGKRRFGKHRSIKPLNIGELVVVYDVNEDMYVRSKVIGFVENNEPGKNFDIYEVEYIDKGLYSYAEEKNIFPIDPTFLQYYEQSITIKLADIKFKDNTDLATVQECVDTIANGEFLIADIVGLDLEGTFLVNIYKAYNEGICLNEVLVDMQFAFKQ